jgi:hypothetical protein
VAINKKRQKRVNIDYKMLGERHNSILQLGDRKEQTAHICNRSKI